MRVALIVEQLQSRVPGGTGRYAAELARALEQTRSPTDELSGWVARGTGGRLDLPISIRSLGTHPLLLSRLWERGLGTGPRKADVVHATTLLVPPKRAAALVVTIHDVVPWTHPETLTPRGVGFHRRMGTRAAGDADLIVTPTLAVADQVRHILAPQAEVIAVPPGFSSDLSVPRDARARRARYVREGDYLLFVGTSEPRKGLDTLLDALSEPSLRDQFLLVVGPAGWGGVDVGQQAAARGIADRVTVTGRVDNADLAALYDGASLVVMPSRAEGFGLPVLEAMSLGVPVITSDDPAMREVGAAATQTFPVGDPTSLGAAIVGVLSDPTLRARMTEMGRTRAKDFDWLASARTLWNLYDRISR
jgi:glycosyltransferase involved in cell wall biosynthesis